MRQITRENGTQNRMSSVGHTCENCNTPNHFASVCRQKRHEPRHHSHETGGLRNAECQEFAYAIIAHVAYEDTTDSYTTVSSINNVQEIPAELTPALRNANIRPITRTMKIFPDSGAGICLAGPQHLIELGTTGQHLIPCNKRVPAVGGSVLTCKGWLPMQFQVRGQCHSSTFIYM